MAVNSPDDMIKSIIAAWREKRALVAIALTCRGRQK